MTCDRCGRYAQPDPDTGYDADVLCPDCQRIEDTEDDAQHEGDDDDNE